MAETRRLFAVKLASRTLAKNADLDPRPGSRPSHSPLPRWERVRVRVSDLNSRLLRSLPDPWHGRLARGSIAGKNPAFSSPSPLGSTSDLDSPSSGGNAAAIRAAPFPRKWESRTLAKNADPDSRLVPALYLLRRHFPVLPPGLAH